MNAGSTEESVKRAGVKERRMLIAEDTWVCERCGELNEEGLVAWEMVRVTRRLPEGIRCVILCDRCEVITPHGVLIDQ